MMRAVWGTLGLAAMTACGSNVACPTPTSAVTYEDVAPIFEAKCNGCHATYRQGDTRYGAPDDLNYDTYQVARRDAFRTARSVVDGSMPYGGVISDHDACMIQAWVNQGTPQ